MVASGGPARAASRPLLDQLWDFFASTRVAVVLIFLIAVAAIAGTLVEQEDLYQDWRPPELYYPFRYGPTWGPLFIRLGLTHAYTSLWFLVLLFLIVVSLIVCSLQRLVPLWRALHKPQVAKSPAFVRRQEVVGQVPVAPGPDPLQTLAQRLRRTGYQVLQTGQSLYADRGRFSRYGPYVIHIGLIIAALAGASKSIPGWDVSHDFWVADGQTVLVPGTSLAFRSDKFTMELYPSGMPKLFRTDGVLMDGSREVVRHSIEVNRPLEYQGWGFYQASWKSEPGIARFNLVEVNSERVLGSLNIDLKNPEPEYPLGGGFKLRVDEYFSDFGVDEAGRPINRSRDISHPVLRLSYLDALGRVIGAQALLVAPDPDLQPPPPLGAGPLRLDQTGIDLRWHTGIKAHRDRSVPYIFTGLGIVLLGMGMTFFVFHRQLWAAVEGDLVAVGARTHKNRFGLKQEMQRLLGDLGGQLAPAPAGSSGPSATGGIDSA